MFSFGKPIMGTPLIFLDSKNAPIGSSEFINKGILDFQFQQYGTITHAGDLPSTWYDSDTSIWFNESKANYLYVDGIDLNFYDSDYTMYFTFAREDISNSGWNSWVHLLHYYVDDSNYFYICSRFYSNDDIQLYAKLTIHGQTIFTIDSGSMGCNNCFNNGSWIWVMLQRQQTSVQLYYGLIGDISSRVSWSANIPKFIPPLDYSNSRLCIGSGIDKTGTPQNGLYGAMNTIYINNTIEPVTRLF